MPVRCQRRNRAGAHRPARIHRRDLAWLPARCPPGAGLRLPGARPLRARRRAPLQPQQAADRPLRQATGGQAALVGVAVRLRDRLEGRRPQLRRTRQRRLRAQVQGDRPGLHLGRAATHAHPLGQHPDLRGPPARHQHAPPGGAGGLARHLRRADERRAAAAHPLPGGIRHRVAAGARLPQRQAPAGKGHEQLLGLQQHRLLRAPPRLPRQRPGQRVQGNGRPPARRRPGADPRRGLQPHRRGQRAGPDPEHARHRQRHLLPTGTRQPALLHQRLRHRQYPRPQPPLRAADGHRFPALLGRRDARGRLPLRPGDHPRPPRPWL
ncbi:hypothetical protein D3C78_469520 [compost metagenome]